MPYHLWAVTHHVTQNLCKGGAVRDCVSTKPSQSPTHLLPLTAFPVLDPTSLF